MLGNAKIPQEAKEAINEFVNSMDDIIKELESLSSALKEAHAAETATKRAENALWSFVV